MCSTRNVDMVRAIGADRVIDYTRDDFTQSAERYDIILECVGNGSLPGCKGVLNPKGTLVLVGAPDRAIGIVARVIGALVWSRFGTKKMALFIPRMAEAFRYVEEVTPAER